MTAASASRIERRRLGRLPRTYRADIMHFSALRMTLRGAELPCPSTNYAAQTKRDKLGQLMNNYLGCCTASAKYHLSQVWIWIAENVWIGDDPELDQLVEAFYALTTGYDKNAPLDALGENPTDQGGNMQNIAEAMVRSGIMLPGNQIERILGAFEVDPQNDDDVDHVIYFSGGGDMGVNLPANVMPDVGEPPKVWDHVPGAAIIGGHDVSVFSTRLPNGNRVINSWGDWYEVTPAFWRNHVTEFYGYVSARWVQATGRTILNMSADDLVAKLGSFGASL